MEKKLELEIKKSLIDKDIDTIMYNPNIVVNENIKNIKSRVLDLLETSDRFDIAVSYIVMSGLQLIQDKLAKFDNKSRLIVTTEGFVTDPNSLRKLKSLDIDVRVYNPLSNDRGFHLKSYHFEKNDRRSLIIGSSNISSRAFGEVHEMCVEISANEDGYIISDYEKTFDQLWSNKTTKILTEEFITEYEKKFSLRKRFEKKSHELMLDTIGIEPNYMQIEALDELEKCRKTSNRGLVVAATGTGKTYLSAFDIKSFNPKKVLFLVHNRTIIQGAKRTYKKIFKNENHIELTSSNLFELETSRFFYTTDKTAYSKLINEMKLEKDFFDYIVYDEAHRVGENTQYEHIINYFKPKFSLGMTATPERTENPDYLFKVFDFVVPYEIRLIDALNNKLICPFTYFGIDVEEKDFLKNNKYNYEEFVPYMINKIEEVGYFDSKLRAIVFCETQTEANRISELLNERNINSRSIVSNNKINTSKIEEYIERLSNDNKNDISILCVVDKFNEGVDIPNINTIIMLRNTKSSIIFLQQLGRGLRLTENEHKFVTVLDFIGNNKNNYTIAQALTGRETVNKESLLKSVNDNFETVSPYINVNMEEMVISKLIKNIAHTYKAKTEIKNKFNDELTRYQQIPDLVDLYNNEVFNELEIFQLLNGDFLTAFTKKYEEKYDIQYSGNEMFLKHFFKVITEFVFRGYDSKQLLEMSKVLSGEGSSYSELTDHLLIGQEGYRKTSIRVEAWKRNKIPFFEMKGNRYYINNAVFSKLKSLNALRLLDEHIELIREVSKRKNYALTDFELISKTEFLLNINSKNLTSMEGEIVDKNTKQVFYPVKISQKSKYPNKILDENTLLINTQGNKNIDIIKKKRDRFVNGGYQFKVGINFVQAKYESTTYFYMGDLEMISVTEIEEYINEEGKKRYNFKIKLRTKNKIPRYLLQYK